MKETAIHLQEETVKRLESMKIDEHETDDALINRLIDELEEADSEYTPEELAEIKAGLEDIRQGRVYTHEEVLKRYGLK